MLTVKDLVFFGIVLIQPIAPVGIFGLSSQMSHGHVSATIVIAMVAMMLTAFSYGRMAALYPSAGSAYTYVGRGLNPHLGFLAGWAMCLDYLIIPVINIILIGVLSLAGALWIDYAFAAELLNFGAFLAFLGVNLATIREYYFRRREGSPRILADLVAPGAGFVFCLVIWLSLPLPAKIAGGVWLVVGLLYDGVKSRGFRTQPAPLDFGDV